MAYLFTSYVDNGEQGYAGNVYYATPGATSLTSVTVPTGVRGTGVRPIIMTYRGRAYIFGQFSRPLVFTENNSLSVLGIPPPVSGPTLANNGIGTVEGECIGYFTFVHKLPNGVLVGESNKSVGSTTLTMNGSGRTWTDLPAASINAAVTHVRGYVSMDGAEPRLAWERPVGVTSVSEGVATASLGAVAPTKNGPPPYTKYAAKHHDRIWYAGDPSKPYRLYFSEIGLPGAVGSTSFMDTKDGDTITGIAPLRDLLVVFTRTQIYVVSGYGSSDFVIDRASPARGCIAHHSIVNIHDRLWFASQAGVCVFDGTVKFVMQDIRDHWISDYNSNTSAYEDCIAVNSRKFEEYRLLIPKTSEPKGYWYYGNYSNFEPGASGDGSQYGQPDWTLCVRNRNDRTAGTLTGSRTFEEDVYSGGCDGYIRKEDVASNTNDDSDTYNKRLTIRTGHMLYNDPGGGRNHGKALTDLDVYMLSESQAWTLKVWGGDEDASEALSPHFTATLSAGALSSGGQTFTKKANWKFRPTVCSGRGFTTEIQASSHINMEYRGLSGSWKAGMATRPRKT